MKKSAKLSLALALMMGTTAGVQMLAPNSASAEISDKFRLELNGVLSYFNDTDHNYYGGRNQRVDTTYLTKGWNHYTRLAFSYNIDRDTRAYARVHSGYDAYGDYYNYDKNYAYFDQAYIQFNDRKSNLHYILGKRGMTLGQSMVYNATGNQTGIQVTLGNWYDPNNLMLFWGNRKGGQRVWGAQAVCSPVKPVSLNLTYLQSDSEYYNKKTSVAKVEKDKFIDAGTKIKLGHNSTLVGEYARNMSGNPSNTHKVSGHNQGWFIEYYTGPTNDFGSGLPLQKVGTHVFSVRYQDIGQDGTSVHNNTFYDDRKGIRLDYGYVFKKGMSADLVIGRMKDKGTSSNNDPDKGKWSNIVVASLAYKFK